MPYNKPNWLLLKECGEKLTRESKTPFTRKQLIECVQEKHPDRKEDSLNPMIQGMTVNLKGGAPGGIGKNVFYSVGRGLFELYDPKKHGPSEIYNDSPDQSEEKKIKETSPPCNGKVTEDEIRNLLMKVLYQKMGKPGSWKGSGKTASFDLKDEFKGYKCSAEHPLFYELPTGIKMSHTSDILISNEEKKRYISIEIKYRSAVTDQFKCRSYDMIHLKNSYGNNLFGIMVYVKSTTGISVEHAKSICYSFDYFFSIPSALKDNSTAWDKLIWEIEKFLQGEKEKDVYRKDFA